MTPAHPFGQRDWSDVRSIIASRLYRRYPGTSPDDIDDAVGLAVVDLFDYWVNLPSSLDAEKPRRNFEYALLRGTRMAVHFLHQAFNERVVEPLIIDGDDGPSWVVLPPDNQRSSAEDEAIALLDMERLVEVVHRLPIEELEGWYSSFIDGETVVTAGQNAGVSHQAISRRRQRGLERLRREVHE